MMNTMQKGDAFESQVFSILEKTHPFEIQYYKGPSDRGRDIIVKYNLNGHLKTIIVECKNYSSKVSQRDISNSVNWAAAHKPNLYYLWTTNYVTPDAKDYIERIAELHEFVVRLEEKDSVEKYIKALKMNDSVVFKELRKKLITLVSNTPTVAYMEYETRVLPSNHEIVNREHEIDALLDEKHTSYFIWGPSCVGKTHIAKIVAKKHHDNGSHIFWHRVLNQDSEMQMRSVLGALSAFFSTVCQDNSLVEYLKDHGSFMTNQLLTISQVLMEKYSPVIFMDDVHKCAKGNNQFIELLSIFIQNEACTIYILGWFSIFDNALPEINKHIQIIKIDPMNPEHIRAIARNVKADVGEDVLNLIVKRSEGLPGYAELMPQNSEFLHIDALDVYFKKLVEHLSFEEQIIILSLAIAHSALSYSMLSGFKSGYSSACESLCSKLLVKRAGDTLELHDIHKESIKRRFKYIPEECFSLLKTCAEENPLILFDLANIHCELKQYDRFHEVLNENFKLLIDNGFDVMLLQTLQYAEIAPDINYPELLLKKMILLERKSEYDILGTLIEVTESVFDMAQPDYSTWDYIRLRYLYFQNDYNTIIEQFFTNSDKYSCYPAPTYLQILFIVGRCFYVMGDLETATELYYYIFNIAFRENQHGLRIKALHRICIIEEKLGLFKDAMMSIETLINSYHRNTVKRISFAHYRIAKCLLGINNYELAHTHNNKSMEIKESLDAKRGILFCQKLRAQINLKEKNLAMALTWGQSAYEFAQKIGLQKETASVGMTFAQTLLEDNQTEQAALVLEKSFLTCERLNLCHRLSVISDMCRSNGLTDMAERADKALKNAKLRRESMASLYKNHLRDSVISNINPKRIEQLTNKQSLSKSLLLTL